VVSFEVSLMTERAVVIHDLSKLSTEQAAEMYEFPNHPFLRRYADVG
jgi:hypothetical protein